MKKLSLVLISLALLAGATASLGGCSSTIENRDPSGEPFPSVEATSLAGETVRIPEDFAGAPVLLLVGYVQGSQFDIDRWLYGAIDADLEVALREVPAARGAAASLAKGTTILRNAAREPEIVDLADCLRKMGAQIDGDGTPDITIQGVDRLHGATHQVVTDRIELGTYMLAPAICGGEVELLGGRRSLLESFCSKLEAAGIEITEGKNSLTVSRKNGRLQAVDVVTEPFPGFPTDLQAQMMALMCTAEGTSVLEEKIFENRFMHAPELTRMGAQIEVHGGHATVTGVEMLKGAPVMATDLRASVSLILAGLAAEGETKVSRVYHLDRGYEHVVRKLSGVGAKIERIREE